MCFVESCIFRSWRFEREAVFFSLSSFTVVTRFSGERVALKVIELEHITTEISEISKEVQMMRMCCHPNVLCCRANGADTLNGPFSLSLSLSLGLCVCFPEGRLFDRACDAPCGEGVPHFLRGSLPRS